MTTLADHRVRRSLVVTAVLVLVATGCTTQARPDPTRLVHEPRVVGGHVVDPGLSRQVDAVFAGYSFRDRRALLVNVDGWTVLRRQDQSARRTRLPVEEIQGAVLATLIGIAVDERRIGGVDQTLGELLPSEPTPLPEGARAVTLRQLLSMPSGAPILGQLEPMQLLSAVIQQTGVSTAQYAQQKLFGPLGLWVPPTGLADGGAGLSMTARELARLGQLWLDRGVWRGQRIVSAAWVVEMTRARTLTDESFLPAFGYQLWLTQTDGRDAFVAAGAGGQMIEVVPDIGLVVVVQTAPNAAETARGRRAAGPADYANLVNAVIAPAIS